MTEAEFSLSLVRARLEPLFVVAPEVWMRHWSGEKIRIDYVASPREGSGVPDGIYGFEIKKDPAGFKDTSGAYAQAIDYQGSVIDDLRKPPIPGLWNGQRLRYTFVAQPWCWQTGCKAEWDSGAFAGVIRLAGKFGVGLVTVGRYSGLSLYVGPEPIWKENDGARSGIESWHTRNSVGHRS